MLPKGLPAIAAKIVKLLFKKTTNSNDFIDSFYRLEVLEGNFLLYVGKFIVRSSSLCEDEDILF